MEYITDTMAERLSSRKILSSSIPRTVWCWAGITALAYFVLAMVRLHTGRATTWDFGYFSQVLWLIGQGHWAARSTLNGHLALTDAGSAILYPIGWIYPYIGATGLLLLQSLSLAAGIPFIAWWLSRYHLRKTFLYWGVLSIYAVYPAVLGPALFDWHPDTLAVPVLFYAAWAIETRNPKHFWLAAGLLLLTKVTATLTMIGFTVPWLMRRQWRLAVGTFLLGVLFAVGEVGILFPRLTGHTMAQWVQYYGWLGPNPMAGLTFIVVHAPTVVLAMVHKVEAFYLLSLLIPIGVIPALVGLWYKGWAYPAWIVMAFNMLSSFRGQQNPFNQYSVSIVPFLFIGLIVVLPRLSFRTKALPVVLSASSVALCLILWFSLERPMIWYADPPQAALQEVLKMVPKAVPLYGQNSTLSRLSDRASVRLLPLPHVVAPGTMVVLNRDQNPMNHSVSASLVLKTLKRLRKHRTIWRMVFHHGPVWVFQRRRARTDQQPSPRILNRTGRKSNAFLSNGLL